MNVDGFPTTIGSFSVDAHMAATIHPAPIIQGKSYNDANLSSLYFTYEITFLPGHSCKSVKCPTASRLVAIKRQPGFSRMQRVPYLAIKIMII